ncbi:MAG: hypothetical protein WCA04_01865 [Geobacteraceae bacterium]
MDDSKLIYKVTIRYLLFENRPDPDEIIFVYVHDLDHPFGKIEKYINDWIEENDYMESNINTDYDIINIEFIGLAKNAEQKAV